MEITLTTPALLFSTVSLTIIAFTSRYLAVASLIRDLHERFQKTPDNNYVEQIKQLHRRIYIIRNIQFLIVSSLFLSAVCMLAIFFESQLTAKILFFLALLLQILALALSIWEISISIRALKIELSDMQEQLGNEFDLFGRGKKK